ncbi:MAG TPA: tetratricopeptide repeat-containing serine protease family protein, partial [Candidatus Obscuribacterales bacterium]
MVAPLQYAIVRIRKSNGAIVGAGFLVHEKYVLTCAHVITQALGISESTPQCPSEPIHLDFPLIDPAVQLTAQVVLWRPAPAKGASTQSHEDIAALKLNSSPPPSAKPVRLLLEDDLWDHPFQAFGFPAGHDDGLWSTGVLRAKQGTGWVQVEDIKSPGGRLESGYSGTPIWDEKLNGVVGMAVAADLKRAEAKIAFIIPTRLIATTWTALAELTIPPLILVSKKPNRSLQWILASLFGLAALGSSTLLIPQVRDRLGLGEAACFREAERNGEKAIALIKFHYEPDSPTLNPLLPSKVQERLEAQLPPHARLCLVNSTVSRIQQAEVLGKNYNAAVVVWGRSGGSTLDVKVTPIKYKVEYLITLSSPVANAPNFEVEAEDWAQLVSLMVAFHISQAYEQEGRTPAAISTLLHGLSEVEKRKLNRQNTDTIDTLSMAYYFLGRLYAPSRSRFCLENWKKCIKAIAAYDQAFNWNTKFYEALLSQASLYEQIQSFQQAINIYTRITKLESLDPSLLLEVRKYRADLYELQGDFAKAVKERQWICQQDDQDLDCFRTLG